MRHESWLAGFGPAGVLWQVAHVDDALLAGSCTPWQSMQPLPRVCAPPGRAFSLWQEAQSTATIAGSPWGLWHPAHGVVACCFTAAE